MDEGRGTTEDRRGEIYLSAPSSLPLRSLSAPSGYVSPPIDAHEYRNVRCDAGRHRERMAKVQVDRDGQRQAETGAQIDRYTAGREWQRQPEIHCRDCKKEIETEREMKR